jgi:3',5'-cyclic AMP phosphodiesterase CpdA
MALKIVHLSDLHFGDEYFLYATLNRRWYKYRHDDTLLQNLANAIVDHKPDAIVVSGDIVSKENYGAFEQASDFLQKILERLGLSARKHLIVIPGNHDARILKRLSDDPLSRIQGFRSFLGKLQGISAYETKERSFWLFPVHRICIVGFDSTLKGETERKGAGPADVAKISEGAVGRAQLTWFREAYSDFASLVPDFQNYYKIAVVHHHPFPLSTGGQFMQMDDADDFLTMLATPPYFVDMILHGHKHIPRAVERGYGAHPFVVISAGTALFNIIDEQAGFGNNFNVITVEDTRVRCERYKADQYKRFVLDQEEGKPAIFEFLNRRTVTDAAAAVGLFSDRIVKTLNLQNAKDGGESIVEIWHDGLQIVEANTTLSEITRPISVEGRNASVKDVQLIPEGTDSDRVKLVKVEGEGTRVALYTIAFDQPLNQSSLPVKFALRWTLAKGHCMAKKNYGEYYPANTTMQEDTSCDFEFPVRQFQINVQFPYGYSVEPTLTIMKHGSVVRRDRIEFDRMTHQVRHTLEQLGLGMKCMISWLVPD